MTDRDAYILLNAVPGIPPRTKHRLLTALGSPVAVLQACRDVLADLGTERAADRIAKFRAAHDADRLLAGAAAAGARILTLADSGYPPALRALPDPPLALYVRGQLPDAPCVAVVGTRRPSTEGVEVARSLAADLAAAGAGDGGRPHLALWRGWRCGDA